MTMRIPVLGTTAVLLALIGSGCARSPRVNFYTLSPGGEIRPLATIKAPPAINVGPVTLPELVDRPQLVVRIAENRVAILEAHRWAEPLKSELPRLLAQNLGQLLGTDRVSSYRQSAAADAQYRVLVDIVRLESVPGDSVTLEANWTLRRPGGARRTGRSLVREKVAGQGYDALVAACSRALYGVSGDIAQAIREEEGAAR
jgi:uncharacterized lipoprotein YmbA